MDKTDPKPDSIFLKCMDTIEYNTNEVKTYTSILCFLSALLNIVLI